MKILVMVDRVAALKAGKDKYGMQTVEVPAAELSQEHRELLAEMDQHVEADFKLPAYGYTIAEATKESVVAALEQILQQRKQAAAEWCASSLDHRVLKVRWNDVPKLAVGTPEYREASEARKAQKASEEAERAKQSAEQAQRDADAEARRQAQAKANAEAEAAGKQALTDWVKANGSDLCKARMEEGFEWIGLAEREFAVAQLPQAVSGLEDCSDPPAGYESEVSDRTTPTMLEIQLLRKVREELKDNSTATLRWTVYTPDYGDDCDVIKQPELRITVTCPTGRTLDFDYLIPTKVEA